MAKTNKYGKLIIYASSDVVFVCRPEDEEQFLVDLEDWGYFIDAFKRIEQEESVMIEYQTNLIVS